MEYRMPDKDDSMMTANVDTASGKNCRFCGSVLKNTFLDLGMSPLCESYLSADQLNKMEPFYPLHVHVCDHCFLVQLEEYVSPEHIFKEYAYFSSYSDTWLEHSKAYVNTMIEKLALNSKNLAVEVASNDGYLLQYFVEKEIPVLGIEPAINVAEAAIGKGIPTVVEFFGEETAKKLVIEKKCADLLIGNNVLAQVPDINDFVEGLKILLKPNGIITMEFPHLQRLMEGNQFDTVYHEHFSYFSLLTVEKIFLSHGLMIFDVEELPTHGGSLRIFARHCENISPEIGDRVKKLRDLELAAGLDNVSSYMKFAKKVEETKWNLLEFLIQKKREGKSIAGYGAPGKGNTLLNYCGIRSDFLDYTVDRNPYKQGKYLPGTHIPIFHPDKIRQTKPDYVFILPWNFLDEIIKQLSFIREWGGIFIVPIPEVKTYI